MTTNPDEPLIQRLRAQLLASLRHHVDGRPYALLDFPAYANVGDSALWLGARAVLEDLYGAPPAYIASHGSFDIVSCRRLVPTGTIYLLGGGNFGDLYPAHQRFREEVVTRLPSHPVVQLPQSVMFQSPAQRQRSAPVLASHPLFTVYVRDRESETVLREMALRDVRLAPDLAFGLGALARPAAPIQPTMRLLRSDDERRVDDDREAPDPSADWLHADRRLLRNRMALGMLRRPWLWRRLSQAMQRQLMDGMAHRRLAFGLRLLSRGELLLTDRLHGHILATLAGIPHEIETDRYGKIRNFVTQWTREARAIQRTSWDDRTQSEATNRASSPRL